MDDRSVDQRLIGVGGDPFFAAAPALADLLPSERERIIREHAAVEYRQELRRLMALGVAEPDELEEEE